MHWQRIFDVNLNRLTESLKFVEDYIRFSIQDKLLLNTTRKIREDFLKIKKGLPLRDLVIFRKSIEDLGRKGTFDRINAQKIDDLLIANFSRIKESLRIGEELLKLENSKMSGEFKELRFRIYDLEKSIITLQRKSFNPQIYVILDEKYLKIMPLKKLLQTLQNSGATMVQLRIKKRDDNEFLKWAKKLRRLLKKPDVKFIINNRIDITLACGADGVHLGQDDIPIKEARKILGDSFIIGASVHNPIEAKRAEEDGADYLGVGAIFETKTKSDAVVCGLKNLKAICENVKIPVVGIGGINDKNYKKVFESGASGIALCSYLFEGDLKKNLRAIRL